MANAINVKDASGATVSVATNDAIVTALQSLLSAIQTDALTDTELRASALAVTVDGVATATKQDTLNTSLQSILTALGAELSVGLPTGAATDASIETIGTRTYNWATGQHLDIGATSVESTAITGTEFVIVPSVDCYIAIGTTPTAAIAAGSMFVNKGVPAHFRITSGDKVAVIAAGSDTGKASVMAVV